MAKRPSALLTDLYQLNMMAAYLEHGLTDTAVFELFVRKLPARRGFLMAAGLEQALQFLETVSFTPEDLDGPRLGTVFRELPCLSPVVPLYRRRRCDAGRNGVLSRTSRSCG